MRLRGSPTRPPPRRWTASVDRLVWYAGWSDKFAQVAGSANPVAGPYFDFSVPEPTGVVGVLAPQGSSLLGLVSVVAPVITTGNAAVVVASEARPLPALDLAEVLATSDLPGGVVNILTGRTAELAPVLAAHRDVDALDLAGAPEELEAELEEAAADNVKRVLRRPAPGSGLVCRTEPGADALLRRDQDCLAPRRRLSAKQAVGESWAQSIPWRTTRRRWGCRSSTTRWPSPCWPPCATAGTPPPLFRLLAKRLALVLCVEATRSMPTDPLEVETPLARTTGAAHRQTARRRPRAAGRALGCSRR